MANEWIDDEVQYQAALDDAAGDDDAGEIRYGLTPLGALALDEGRQFAGFGPCARAVVTAQAAPSPSRRRSEARRRVTPLFG